MVMRVTGVCSVVAAVAVGLVLTGCAAPAQVGSDLTPLESTLAATMTSEEPDGVDETGSSGITPAVAALMDDLGAYIDDGDVGIVADIDGEPSGYASFVIRTDQSAVDLYWKGPVPARVTEVIAAHPDVEVGIHPVTWSLSELVAGRDVAVKILMSDDFAKLDFQGVGPMSDASGLKVILGEASAAEVRAVKAAIESATGITAFVETGVHIKSAASRPSDANPFSGGALVRIYGGSNSLICSTGVAVVGKTTGREYLTTAATALVA